DFPINDLAMAEALAMKLEEVYERHYRNSDQHMANAHYYYCKALYRVCYYLDQIGDSYPFSYTVLHNSTNPQIKPIIAKLEQLKKNDFDQKSFDQAHPTFERFVRSLRKIYV
ncbi:MAG: hypothetical protein NUV85_02175, partial [Candidatus Berkelbacteria bacterium]|nr:hypothetical protein [Candidatus Berkelbacteria bacterium]